MNTAIFDEIGLYQIYGTVYYVTLSFSIEIIEIDETDII